MAVAIPLVAYELLDSGPFTSRAEAATLAGRDRGFKGSRMDGHRDAWAAHLVIVVTGGFVGVLVAAGLLASTPLLARGGWRIVDVLALLALPLPLVLLLRRPPAERSPLRRIARGVRSIEGEVERLGPAFGPVVEAAWKVAEGAAALARDARRTRDALRRTAWVESRVAADRRREVEEREVELIRRLGQLADHLEVLTTELSVVDIEAGTSRALGARMRELGAELEAAVAARDAADRASGG